METHSALVVDGEKNIRLSLSKCLSSLGLKVDTAINGEEALDRLADKAYDLLLLDLKLPGMGGMDLFRKVRELYPKMKAIFVTAHGSIETAVQAMKLGASDFIQKPFAPEEISEAASAALNVLVKPSQKAGV